MPSPHHPAMDPRIERQEHWRDFHGRLIGTLSAQLNGIMPPGYVATTEARIRYQSAEDEGYSQDRDPDVAVLRHRSAAPAGGGGAVATLEPVTLEMPEALLRTEERYVQVLHKPSRELVTQIEVLSPANKAEPHRGDYLVKRREAWGAFVNLLEIDLLRGGRRPEPEDQIPREGHVVLLSRRRGPGAVRPPLFMYRWAEADPLPTVPVPLRPDDGDVPLDLAAAVARAYDDGRYDELLDPE